MTMSPLKKNMSMGFYLKIWTKIFYLVVILRGNGKILVIMGRNGKIWVISEKNEDFGFYL